MASRGAGARNKGAAFERTLSKFLTEKTGREFKRGIGQSRNGGKEIPDVYSEQVAGFHIEAKNQKACSIKAAVAQALEDSQDSGKIIAAITRDTGKDTLVTMLLEDWVKLFKAYLDQS